MLNNHAQHQYMLRSTQKSMAYLKSLKEKKPCLGMYTPKFTLLDKYRAFTFPKSTKAVCEPLINRTRSFDKPHKLRKIQSTSIVCHEKQAIHQIANYGFAHQLGRKSVPNELNEKRFEYMPTYTSTKWNVNFRRITERPELFKPPEFLHEYYINLNKECVSTKEWTLARSKSSMLI